MPSFSLRGLTLELPRSLLTGKISHALSMGRYEKREANAVLQHLRPGDRFLDLGSGIGYICSLAARVVGAGSVTGIEAAPEVAEVARRNLEQNGFGTVRLIHGAVTGRDQGDVEFVIGRHYWANALPSARDPLKGVRVVRVPGYPIAQLLEMVRPTFLCVDIEGAELEVLAEPLPGVRVIVMEFHPRVYGDAGIDQIAAGLETQGFQPVLSGSKDATAVFRRKSG